MYTSEGLLDHNLFIFWFHLRFLAFVKKLDRQLSNTGTAGSRAQKYGQAFVHVYEIKVGSPGIPQQEGK